jgi:hypothetical protein
MTARCLPAIAAIGSLLLLAGCGSGAAPPGDPVALTTYEGDGSGCYLNAEPFLLVPDAETGVAMAASPVGGSPPGSATRWPVAWPSGYVGRRVGEEVAVYSSSGRLVATTGKYWYMAATGNADSNPWTRPFDVGCTADGLTEWDPSGATPS